MNRVVKLEPALFIQHHQRHGCYRFGHRVNTKNRVLLHGSALFEFKMALRFEIDDFPFSGDQGEGPRKPAGVYVAFVQMHTDTVKTLR